MEINGKKVHFINKRVITKSKYGVHTWDLNKINKILLPCPFCGAKAQMERLLDESTNQITYDVECSRCPIETEDFISPMDAILVWNRRVEKEKE